MSQAAMRLDVLLAEEARIRRRAIISCHKSLIDAGAVSHRAIRREVSAR
jgi:hypothetical protein